MDCACHHAVDFWAGCLFGGCVVVGFGILAVAVARTLWVEGSRSTLWR